MTVRARRGRRRYGCRSNRRPTGSLPGGPRDCTHGDHMQSLADLIRSQS